MQNVNVKFTLVSGNKKTGPITTTMTESSTCPSVCPLIGNGCYAAYGPTAMHWKRTDKGENVLTWADYCSKVRKLPDGHMVRHNVAGDLPHTNQMINADMVYMLAVASARKRVFTYTHHNVIDNEKNMSIVATINQCSDMTINLSANNMEHADQLIKTKCGPVTVLMPENAEKVTHTPDGNTVVLCPATYRDDTNCMNCGICAVKTRKAIIGFPVHGTAKKKAAKVITIKAIK